MLAPRGTILAAVGEARDNGIAGDVLQRIQAQRAAREAPTHPPPTPHQQKLGWGDKGIFITSWSSSQLGMSLRFAPKTRFDVISPNSVWRCDIDSHLPTKHSSGSCDCTPGPPAPPAPRPYLGPMNKTVFGAVYEHTWNGRPVYVADTDQIPERSIAHDNKQNPVGHGRYCLPCQPPHVSQDLVS